MFADVLGMPVSVSETEEAAAWGAALCAGAGVGLFPSPRHDPRDLAAISRSYTPDPVRHARMDARYRVYSSLIEGLSPLWSQIEALGDLP